MDVGHGSMLMQQLDKPDLANLATIKSFALSLSSPGRREGRRPCQSWECGVGGGGNDNLNDILNVFIRDTRI